MNKRLFIKIRNTVLVMICMLLCGEISAKFYAYLVRPLMSGNQRFEEKYFVLGHLKRHCPTVLLVGGAKMNKSIYPDLLARMLNEQGFELQVVNLAFDDATTFSETLLLQAAISNNIRASLIVDSLSNNTEITSTSGKIASAKNIDDGIRKSYFSRCICQEHSKGTKALRCWLEEHLLLLRYWSSICHSINQFAKVALNNRELASASRLQASDHSMNVAFNGWNPDFNILDEPHTAVNDTSIQTKESIIPSDENSIENFCQRNKLPRIGIKLPVLANKLAKKAHNNTNTSTDIDLTDSCSDTIDFSTPVTVNIFGGIEATKKLAAILSKEPYRHLLHPSN